MNHLDALAALDISTITNKELAALLGVSRRKAYHLVDQARGQGLVKGTTKPDGLGAKRREEERCLRVASSDASLFDGKQAVSQATWDVYARCLTPAEMDKNFYLATFLRELVNK